VIRSQRDSYARTDDDLSLSEFDGAIQHFGDPLGDAVRIADARNAVEQDDELVPTEAGRGVCGAQASPQASATTVNSSSPAL
jgi:hypothetical protein